MAINFENKYETERRINTPATEKTVDKLYGAMYNDGNSSTKSDVGNYVKKQPTQPDTTKRFGFAPEINSWAKKNQDAIKYAGDGAINSIKKASNDYLNEYLKDAPEETDKDELFGSIAKWQLARDANDEKRGNVARNNIIGHMSTENKDHYLKEQIPFSEYVKAKDEFDYKHKNYTTTEFLDNTPDEIVRREQQKLNELGYTDKFGERLKEDGIEGAKTRYAKDNYEADNAHKYITPKGADYQIDYAMYYPERDAPRMLTDEELAQKYDKPQLTKMSYSYPTPLREYREAANKYDHKVAIQAKKYSDDALELAEKYAEENGFYTEEKGWFNHTAKELITWDNEPDALRHMSWCSMMAREIKSEASKFISDNHEIEALRDMNYIINETKGVVRTKMNQATLMDLWNNKVGRELASMPEFKHMDYEELFEYAKKNGYLITDASKAYNFYGVEDYIVDPKNWAVTVEWDLNKDYLTFYKGYGRDREEITLRIGPKEYK